MAEILDFIFEILRVQDFANKYTTPLDQFLFAIFFPSVILVLFVELLTASALRDHGKKLTTLLSVSFYIFIIVYPPGATYSLYSMFAPILGTVWYLFVILLGFMFFLFNRLFAKEATGVRAESRLLYAGKDIWDTQRQIKDIEAQISAQKVEQDKIKIEGGPEVGKRLAEYDKVIADLNKEKQRYKQELDVEHQARKHLLKK